MSDPLTTNRTSRNRRILAVIIWLSLIGTACVLGYYGRYEGHIQTSPYEPIAFMLSVFSLFMTVFAWMLFNPDRRPTSESPALFFSGVATLAPPCVIGFCLMEPESGLRFWLAVCLFMLGVVAILSPIPEEFFAIPRSRHSYLLPSPTIDISSHLIDLPETDLLSNSELKRIVSDAPRSSLAPSAYRIQPPEERETRRAQRKETLSKLRRYFDRSEDSGGTDSEATSTKPTSRQHQSGTSPKQSPRSSTVPPPTTAAPAASAMNAVAAESVIARQPANTIVPPPLPEQSDVEASDSHSGAHQHTPSVLTPDKPREEKVDPFLEDSRIADSTVGEVIAPPGDIDAETASTTQIAHEGTDSEQSAQDQSAAKPGLQQTAADQPAFERFKDESGAELIEGTMRVRFEPGQKRANVHVPFSPPMSGAPDVECESVGDVPLRLKVPVRQSYGIRIEARRSDTDSNLETEIGFSAIYNP